MGDTLPADPEASSGVVPTEPIQSLRLLEFAIAEAATLDVAAVAVAVVDPGGRLVGFHSMPGTLLTSDDVAIAKAFTAAAFRASTSELAQRVPADRFAQIAHVSTRKIVSVPGGLPVYRDSQFLGAVGVSGATAAQDEQVARAALGRADLAESVNEEEKRA